jgi:hypothetical protein
VSVLFGIVLILLGLLFLAGAGGEARRVVIGLVGVGCGAALVGFGIRAYKLAEAYSPEQIRAEILELARQRSGEISNEDIAAVLGRRETAAEPVLNTMLTQGVCRRRVAEGSVFYLFPELQPRLMVVRCQYCDTDFDLAGDVDKCPNCGGAIHTKVASVSLSDGEYFHMDEQSDPDPES